MHSHSCSKKRPRIGSSVCASLVACSMLLYTPRGFAQNQNGNSQGNGPTASPIKHVNGVQKPPVAVNSPLS